MLFLAAVTRVLGADPDTTAGEMLDDAELTAVFFLDSDLGWVVGERGVILRTENGGRHWEVQPSPVTCRLESVHFADAQHGWIVGGRVHSYSQRTSGVVLRTQDGGRSWTQIPGLTLPTLKRVQFLNLQQGWAAGGATTLYPTGILRTDDGGRSWSALPSGPCGSWLTADFRDFQSGIVAGRDGQLARVVAPVVGAVESPESPESCWRAVRLADSRSGWAAGDGGCLLHTTDGGQTWMHPAGSWPEGLSSLFDFRALAVSGNHVWVAGAPGTCVLHSPDGGSTWELGATDQTLPLRALTFVDAERGWAVGVLGTILGTRDGGRTWRRLRGGGTRVALLGIFSEPNRVPWEVFAWECGNDGYLGAVELIARREARGSAHASAATEDAACAAMAAVGGSVADGAMQLPAPDPGLRLASRALLASWDRATGGRALDLLEERLVRKIRQWRPEIVVTEAANPPGADPLGHLLNQLVVSAVRNASDDKAHPEHRSLGGLPPWTVKKVFSVAPSEHQPTVTLTTSQLVTRLGCAVADLASEANAKVLTRYRSVPPTVGLQLLVDELPQSAGRKDIFSGVYLPAGGDARRLAGPAAVRDIDALRVAAQKRRNIEQIIASAEGDTPQSAGWLGQIQDLTKSLGTAGAGDVLYQLGQRYLETGELELAAPSFAQLVERYPGHALSESALEWLIQYYASSEIAWQLHRRQQLPGASRAERAVDTQTSGGVALADFAPPPGVPAADVHTADLATRDAAGPTSFEMMLNQRAAQTLNLAKLIQHARPELFAEPRVQFPISVAYRHRDLPREAEKLCHRLGASPLSPHWAHCAAGEQWLHQGRGAAPKATYYVTRAASRPRLDGQLDDEIWRAAEPLSLRSAHDADDLWPAVVMLACDDAFLFIAGTCRKSPHSPPAPTAQGTRIRDASLDEHDRIDLLIDIDRDYVSFYRLTVDHRGWAGEACLGDTSWNPVWYVASQETDADWTLEVAVPLDELTSQPPRANDAWAVGVQRIVPGVGLQAFTQPAATDPQGEGFGWMVFR